MSEQTDRLEKADSAVAHAIGEMKAAIDDLNPEEARMRISMRSPMAVEQFGHELRDLLGDLADDH